MDGDRKATGRRGGKTNTALKAREVMKASESEKEQFTIPKHTNMLSNHINKWLAHEIHEKRGKKNHINLF